jgi:hypothetical protein
MKRLSFMCAAAILISATPALAQIPRTVLAPKD